jgi:hypothetical protein
MVQEAGTQIAELPAIKQSGSYAARDIAARRCVQ